MPRVVEGAPGCCALRLAEEGPERVDATFVHVGIGILRCAESFGVDDPEVWRVCGAADSLDGADQAVAARLVVVEGQGDRLDAVLP